jgi:pilus assembly protein CpaE
MITSRILVASRGDALLRAVVAAGGAGCQTVGCARVTDLERMLDEHGPFDAVVAGPAFDNHTGMHRLALLRHLHPEVGVVLAFAPRPRSSQQELVRAGAIDLVVHPSDDLRALGRALQAACRHARIMSERHTVDLTEVPASPAPLGTVLTVASSTGGCGKTFYSTNLAYHLAKVSGQRVCLADLDLQFGEVSTALRLKPRYSVADALAGDVSEEDLYEHIEEYMTPHPSGLSVLTAPKDPSEADEITPTEVTKVIRVLRRRFDYVIVDTPAQLSETVLAAFDQSSRLLCLATFDLPSVRNTTVFLATLDKLKIPTEDITVILNKVEAGIGIEVDEVDEVFDHRIEFTLPYSKEVSRSINNGLPVIGMAPQADISRRLRASMGRWSPEAEPVEGRPAGAESAVHGWWRLFKRERARGLEVAVA